MAYLSTIDFTTRFKTSGRKEEKTETGANNFSPITSSFLAGSYFLSVKFLRDMKKNIHFLRDML